MKKLNPIRSASQYGLAQAVASGTSRAKSAMTPAVAREMIEKTPAKMREKFAKELAKRRGNPKQREKNDTYEISEEGRGIVARDITSQSIATGKAKARSFVLRGTGKSVEVYRIDDHGKRTHIKTFTEGYAHNPSGVDLHIGARKKHFDTHAEAYEHGVKQAHHGVHAKFVIVEDGKKHEYRRGGTKNPKRLPKKVGHYKKAYPTGRKIKRRNPESAAVSMREIFTGLPSKKTIVVGEDMHVHSHLAALGKLVELKVKTLKGETFVIGFDKSQNPRKGIDGKIKGWVGRRTKALSGIADRVTKTWINPKKRNPSGPVLLCSTEDGKQLYIEGGDQSLDLHGLGLSELDDKESAVIGTVTNITYHVRKKFDGKEEEYDYVHKFSEQSGGLRPMLRYDIRNKRCFLDGGVYHIGKPLFGKTSAGIED